MKKIFTFITLLLLILSFPLSVSSISDSTTYISASTDKDQVEANGSEKIKITAQFSGGNSEPGANKDAEIEIAVSGGTGNKISPSNTLLTDIDGYVIFYLTSESAGQKGITVIAKTVENDNPELVNSNETRVHLNINFTPSSNSNQNQNNNQKQQTGSKIPILDKILVGSKEYSPDELEDAKITTRTKLTLQGKTNSETTVNIFVSSTPTEGSTISDKEGYWEYSLEKLEEGEHKLQLATTDQVGNMSEKSEPITFTVKKAGETITPTETEEKKSWLPQNKAFYIFAILFVLATLLTIYFLIKKYRPKTIKRIIRKF